jgi:hypothetical protein
MNELNQLIRSTTGAFYRENHFYEQLRTTDELSTLPLNLKLTKRPAGVKEGIGISLPNEGQYGLHQGISNISKRAETRCS